MMVMMLTAGQPMVDLVASMPDVVLCGGGGGGAGVREEDVDRQGRLVAMLGGGEDCEEDNQDG